MTYCDGATLLIVLWRVWVVHGWALIFGTIIIRDRMSSIELLARWLLSFSDHTVNFIIPRFLRDSFETGI